MIKVTVCHIYFVAIGIRTNVMEICEEIYKSEKTDCEMQLLILMIIVVEVFLPLRVFWPLLTTTLLEAMISS